MTTRLTSRLRTAAICAVALLCLTQLTSCMDDSDDDYAEWNNQNKQFVAEQQELKNPDGTPFYEQVTPKWAPGLTILMHWYNDRTKNANEILPLLNSYTAVKYKVSTIEGTPIDSSYLSTDSLYISRASVNITGWQIATLNMRPGDSCRVVMPAKTAYGSNKHGDVKPYSALVYEMKLVRIVSYELPR